MQRSQRTFSLWQIIGGLLILAAVVTVAVFMLLPRQRQQPARSRIAPMLNDIPEKIRELPLVSRIPSIQRESDTRDQDVIDIASEDSFPASDAPGWIRQRV